MSEIDEKMIKFLWQNNKNISMIVFNHESYTATITLTNNSIRIINLNEPDNNSNNNSSEDTLDNPNSTVDNLVNLNTLEDNSNKNNMNSAENENRYQGSEIDNYIVSSSRNELIQHEAEDSLNSNLINQHTEIESTSEVSSCSNENNNLTLQNREVENISEISNNNQNDSLENTKDTQINLKSKRKASESGNKNNQISKKVQLEVSKKSSDTMSLQFISLQNSDLNECTLSNSSIDMNLNDMLEQERSTENEQYNNLEIANAIITSDNESTTQNEDATESSITKSAIIKSNEANNQQLVINHNQLFSNDSIESYLISNFDYLFNNNNGIIDISSQTLPTYSSTTDRMKNILNITERQEHRYWSARIISTYVMIASNEDYNQFLKNLLDNDSVVHKAPKFDASIIQK
ncbi:5042_t:CDS:10, partial [Scutellospora calospora]